MMAPVVGSYEEKRRKQKGQQQCKIINLIREGICWFFRSIRTTIVHGTNNKKVKKKKRKNTFSSCSLEHILQDVLSFTTIESYPCPPFWFECNIRQKRILSTVEPVYFCFFFFFVFVFFSFLFSVHWCTESFFLHPFSLPSLSLFLTLSNSLSHFSSSLSMVNYHYHYSNRWYITASTAIATASVVIINKAHWISLLDVLWLYQWQFQWHQWWHYT